MHTDILALVQTFRCSKRSFFSITYSWITNIRYIHEFMDYYVDIYEYKCID